jgi:hypothetical protein
MTGGQNTPSFRSAISGPERGSIRLGWYEKGVALATECLFLITLTDDTTVRVVFSLRQSNNCAGYRPMVG